MKSSVTFSTHIVGVKKKCRILSLGILFWRSLRGSYVLCNPWYLMCVYYLLFFSFYMHPHFLYVSIYTFDVLPLLYLPFTSHLFALFLFSSCSRKYFFCPLKSSPSKKSNLGIARIIDFFFDNRYYFSTSVVRI